MIARRVLLRCLSDKPSSSRPVLSLLNPLPLPPRQPQERVHLHSPAGASSSSSSSYPARLRQPLPKVGLSSSAPVSSAPLASIECRAAHRRLNQAAEQSVQSLALQVVLTPDAHFDAFNLGTALRGLAKIKDEPRTEDFRRAVLRLLGMMDSRQFSPTQLATTLHLVANSGALMAEVEKSAHGRACVAKLLRRALASTTDVSFRELDCTSASKLVSAVGRLASKPTNAFPELRPVLSECRDSAVHQLNDAVLPHMDAFSPNQLVQAMWSNAQLVKSSEHMFRAAVSTLLRQQNKNSTLTDAYTAKELSILLWSFAKQFTRPGQDFTRLVDATLTAKRQEFLAQESPKELTSLLWSLGCLGVHNTQHLEAVLQHLGDVSKLDDVKALGNIASALAVWRWYDEEVCRQLAVGLTRLAPQCTKHDGKSVVTILWALCSLADKGALQLPEVQHLFAQAKFSARFQVDEHHLENAKQLKQCQLAWSNEFSANSKGGDVPTALWVLGGKWIESLVKDNAKLATPTMYSSEMLEVCKRLGYTQAVQNCVTSNGFCVDLFVHDNVLIEVVPVFGLMSDGQTLTGKQHFKHQLIEKEGFKIVTVAVHEWKQLKGNKSAQLAFLTNKLKQEEEKDVGA